MTDVANRTHWKLRLGLNAAFGLIVFGFLLFMYHGDFLCAGPHGYVKPVLVLTIFASVWDALSSLAVNLIEVRRDSMRGFGSEIVWPSVLLVMFVAAVGFIPIPLWIYQGYGHFRFEGTWANVSCLFGEGYGYMYLVWLGPMLTILSGVRELILRRRLVAPASLPRL